jgi:small-conductance mechanosensitive channel
LLFPWTKSLSWSILSLPLKLLGVAFVIGLFDRLGSTLLNLLEKFWNHYHVLATEHEQRESLRITTTISALKALKMAFIYAIALVLVLAILGVSFGSIFAVSGLAIVAISLGFQNLAKDVMTGCLILWEDQFAIGDVIAIQNTARVVSSGLVENMTLRITQLRNDEGRLITIPNSTIVQVENMTRGWSRVNFSVEVAYDTNIDRAIATIMKVARHMYDDSEWHEQMIKPPEVLGVDDLSHAGMLVRVWIDTKPAQQWRVGREFRRRIRVALEQEQIAIGKPQQESWYKVTPGTNGMQRSQDQQTSGPEESTEVPIR